jgi:hypothetical protein
MDTIPYWDDETLLIYGIFSGFVSLNPQEVVESLNVVVNQEGSVLTSIHLLAALESKQKIKTGGVWLNFRKYLHQLHESNKPEADEINKVIDRVQEIADSELDDREVLRSNFSELLQQRDILTEALNGCIEFHIKVLDKWWIRQLLRDYLERYRNDEVFTPTASTYIPYREQHVAVTNLLDDTKYPTKIARFLLPDNVRFFEPMYDLVDTDRITITGFSELSMSIISPRFGLVIDSGKKKSLRSVDKTYVSVEAKNYDPASGTLMILGQQIQIINQKNKLGSKNESKQAQLMRELFIVNTFPRGVPIRHIYPVKGDIYPQEIIKKSRALAEEINRKIAEKTGVADLITSNKWRFEITPHYLKN